MWRINIVVDDGVDDGVDDIIKVGDKGDDETVQGVRSHCEAPERRIVKERRDCILPREIKSEEGIVIKLKVGCDTPESNAVVGWVRLRDAGIFVRDALVEGWGGDRRLSVVQ